VVQKNKTMAEQDFIKAGFTVVGTENNENKLLRFLKENYPNVIRDTEINLEELKTVLGLPIDEKVNGYGLNFVGRNFARAKYAQKTEKELRLNNTLSKNIDTTKNLVLKGDNLDSLKILKNHYSGKIKCIYIDPPYNTAGDEFVYPDKFDKEEAEVLGLTNLSESDFARMDFSFKTKKSHNGWLAFMYPRLLLARDLLSKDGVIFISIDDNEQANLKLLCDDVFGEENFVTNFIWRRRKTQANLSKFVSPVHDYLLCYSKDNANLNLEKIPYSKEFIKKTFSNPDNDPRGLYQTGPLARPANSSNKEYELTLPNGRKITAKWSCSEETFNNYIKENRLVIPRNGEGMPRIKIFLSELEGQIPNTWLDNIATNDEASKEIEDLLGSNAYFSYPKPIKLIMHLCNIGLSKNDIILDFFAGSGTTGHAVMQLNAEDGGNRKFILCQIDEPIKEDKPAYKFCIDNNLPPVISSITIERLKRAGEKIANAIEADNSKTGLFEEDKKQVPDIGFKVFDSVEAPKLKVDDKGQISFPENDTDALSRIYNMIFTVGLDEPTQVPEEVVKDCIYKIGNHFYITNSEKITSDDYSNAIKNGKVFIDGWTASLNGTLQNYKEDVKIVF
jgi:adenine-specific DNA-methyltransferase